MGRQYVDATHVIAPSMFGRVADRSRPWRAPEPRPEALVVAVIGAGPSGLATAALLRRAGVRSIVFDRGADVGGSWPGRYDSLRLNTVRWMSDLPGLRMPRRYGRWVARNDLVEYLRSYAAHHRLETRLDVEAERVDPSGSGWALLVDGSIERFDGVVVATGHSQRGVVPDWNGRDRFAGRLLRAGEYRRPADHAGRRIVVVGAGSSGGEICVDLARHGSASEIVWSVRSAPQVFPREVVGVPTTPFAPAGDLLPDSWLDRIGPWVERRIYGARDYLPEPARPMMELLAACKEPMTADGIVELVRTGRVRVVAAVESLDRDGVLLVDGEHIAADDVIAATGYRPGLERLVGHLDVLDRAGRPTASIPRPRLGFVGFRVPLAGTLWAIDTDARRVARRLLT
jgi:cation diffusion facilitator CzcD-associated flavoprotein CzcO